MSVRHKVWLDQDGKAFGEEAYRLLVGIEKTGSLRGSLTEFKMSYKNAWFLLRAMERRLGFPLIERKVGGAYGGGSHLTPQARELMGRYAALSVEVEDTLCEIYARHFN